MTQSLSCVFVLELISRYTQIQCSFILASYWSHFLCHTGSVEMVCLYQKNSNPLKHFSPWLYKWLFNWFSFACPSCVDRKWRKRCSPEEKNQFIRNLFDPLINPVNMTLDRCDLRCLIRGQLHLYSIN